MAALLADVLKIRLGRPQDAEALSSLTEKVFRETYGRVIPPQILFPYVEQAFSVQTLAAELAQTDLSYCLAWDQTKLLGFSKFAPAAVPSPVRQKLHGRETKADRNNLAAELVKLYVDKSYQGCGVGAALMKETIAQVVQQGYHTLWFYVWEQNKGAIAFYQRWGFEQVGWQDIFVGPIVFHDWVMQKEIL